MTETFTITLYWSQPTSRRGFTAVTRLSLRVPQCTRLPAGIEVYQCQWASGTCFNASLSYSRFNTFSSPICRGRNSRHILSETANWTVCTRRNSDWDDKSTLHEFVLDHTRTHTHTHTHTQLHSQAPATKRTGAEDLGQIWDLSLL